VLNLFLFCCRIRVAVLKNMYIRRLQWSSSISKRRNILAQRALVGPLIALIFEIIIKKIVRKIKTKKPVDRYHYLGCVCRSSTGELLVNTREFESGIIDTNIGSYKR
jgi:hypothetical protein